MNTHQLARITQTTQTYPVLVNVDGLHVLATGAYLKTIGTETYFVIDTHPDAAITPMDPKKKQLIQEAGWKIGNAQDFLTEDKDDVDTPVQEDPS
jgi:hypothetical protein